MEDTKIEKKRNDKDKRQALKKKEGIGNVEQERERKER